MELLRGEVCIPRRHRHAGVAKYAAQRVEIHAALYCPRRECVAAVVEPEVDDGCASASALKRQPQVDVPGARRGIGKDVGTIDGLLGSYKNGYSVLRQRYYPWPVVLGVLQQDLLATQIYLRPLQAQYFVLPHARGNGNLQDGLQIGGGRVVEAAVLPWAEIPYPRARAGSDRFSRRGNLFWSTQPARTANAKSEERVVRYLRTVPDFKPSRRSMATKSPMSTWRIFADGLHTEVGPQHFDVPAVVQLGTYSSWASQSAEKAVFLNSAEG